MTPVIKSDNYDSPYGSVIATLHSMGDVVTCYDQSRDRNIVIPARGVKRHGG